MIVLEKHQARNELPLAKLILFVLAIFVALGVGISWISNIQTEKRADELSAQAKDAFTRSDLPQGLQIIDQALKLKEKPDYLKTKFNILYNQNKASEAQLVLNRLLTYEPNNAHFYYLSGVLAFNEANLPDALRSLDKAVQLAPQNIEYRLQKAALLIRDEKYKEAAAIYEKLLASDPHYYTVWDQYALGYSNDGYFKQALAIRKRGLQQFPQDYLHHFGMASLWDAMGKVPQAVAEYRRSLELHPLEDSIAAKRIYELTGQRVPAALENLTSGRIPFTRQGKVMFITANVNGQPGTFLLDTGASYSVIYKSKVDKYRIQFIPLVMPFETANGTIQAPIAYGSVRLGKYDVNDIRFAVIPDAKDTAVDGIIGMNVLEQFRFEIDQAGGEITLKR